MLTADNSPASFLTAFSEVLMGERLSQLYFLVSSPRNSEKRLTGQWAGSCSILSIPALPCEWKRTKQFSEDSRVLNIVAHECIPHGEVQTL